MTNKKTSTFGLGRLALLLLALSLLPAAGTARAADDRIALLGLTTAKAVFDVRAGEAPRLWFILKLIRESHRDMVQQDVEPEFIVSFRGESVKLLTKSGVETEGEEVGPKQKIAWMLTELAKEGIRLEGCGVATRMFEVRQDDYLPEVAPVGNSILSLIGYQQRGYALVPMH